MMFTTSCRYWTSDSSHATASSVASDDRRHHSPSETSASASSSPWPHFSSHSHNHHQYGGLHYLEDANGQSPQALHDQALEASAPLAFHQHPQDLSFYGSSGGQVLPVEDPNQQHHQQFAPLQHAHLHAHSGLVESYRDSSSGTEEVGLTVAACMAALNGHQNGPNNNGMDTACIEYSTGSHLPPSAVTDTMPLEPHSDEHTNHYYYPTPASALSDHHQLSSPDPHHHHQFYADFLATQHQMMNTSESDSYSSPIPPPLPPPEVPGYAHNHTYSMGAAAYMPLPATAVAASTPIGESGDRPDEHPSDEAMLPNAEDHYHHYKSNYVRLYERSSLSADGMAASGRPLGAVGGKVEDTDENVRDDDGDRNTVMTTILKDEQRRQRQRDRDTDTMRTMMMDEDDDDDDDEDSYMGSEDIVSSRDEKRARALALPISIHDIVNLPIDEFNERLTKYELTDNQLSLIRDIRRRGKNKVAAQNCRKRKLDQINTLQIEVEEMMATLRNLQAERHHLLATRDVVQDKYAKLYRFLSEPSTMTTAAAAAAINENQNQNHLSRPSVPITITTNSQYVITNGNHGQGNHQNQGTGAPLRELSVIQSTGHQSSLSISTSSPSTSHTESSNSTVISSSKRPLRPGSSRNLRSSTSSGMERIQ